MLTSHFKHAKSASKLLTDTCFAHALNSEQFLHTLLLLFIGSCQIELVFHLLKVAMIQQELPQELFAVIIAALKEFEAVGKVHSILRFHASVHFHSEFSTVAGVDQADGDHALMHQADDII